MLAKFSVMRNQRPATVSQVESQEALDGYRGRETGGGDGSTAGGDIAHGRIKEGIQGLHGP